MFWCWQHTSCCQHRLTARSKKIYSVLTHKASFFLMCILKGECCRWRRDPSAGVCILRLYSSFISKWFHFKSQTFPSSSHSRPRVHSSLVCLCFWKVKGRRHGGGGRRREKKKTNKVCYWVLCYTCQPPSDVQVHSRTDLLPTTVFVPWAYVRRPKYLSERTDTHTRAFG